MTNILYRWGRRSALHPWQAIGAWIVVAVVVVGGASAFGRDLEDSFDVPGADSQAALDLLSEVGAGEAGLTAQVVVSTDARADLSGTDQSADIDEVRAALAGLPNILGVAEPQLSADGSIGLITLQYPLVEDLALADLERLDEVVEDLRVATDLTIERRGDLVEAFAEPESGLGEAAGLVVAMIVLLVAFGSVVAMGLPIVIALFGAVIGVTSMSLVTYLIDIPSWVPLLASMIGLGVGIDYALFLVTRFREHLHDGETVDEAVGRALATAGQAVIFAGGTVFVAILGLSAAGVPFITAAGVGISSVVVIMVLAAITLLPALMGLIGTRIDRFAVGRRRAARSSTSPMWTRWGRHVADHAMVYAVGTTAVLVLAAAPVLALRLGFPDDGIEPESMSARRAYDLVAEGFGPGMNGPLLIAIDTAGDATAVDRVVAGLNADAGVAAVNPPLVDPASGIGSILVIPTSAPQAEATFETVDRLRAEVLPAALDDSAAFAHVGGMTATFGDLADRVANRLPILIIAVVLLSFVLLVAVFRSVLVAAKAALLNLLSIGAAYGVLVAVFQWGWGASLIGVETTVPIVSFIPMFMFAILFGLSMDYEVFLLSRVRERFIETGDNHESVVHGIASTARVITSAALIMISVFGGFVFGADPLTKMFGLGLATAIFVDASIVRLVLVPATMELLGNANWWLPGWLDRLLPVIDLEGGPTEQAAPHGALEPERARVGANL